MANLKPFLDGTKIAMEHEATSRFGAAVEDFSRGAISAATGLNLPGSKDQVPFNRNDGSFYATSYAAALAGATSYRPKLKFLFKVEFIFTEAAVRAYRNVLGGAHANDFTFMVRAVDRPKIDFEYEDDVNMYNFRTKVLKKIRHRELTITFMDDTGNRVLNFFRALMMIQSPITRRQLQREKTTRKPDPHTLDSANGMQFSGQSVNILDNAHRGTLDSSVGNVIETIRVKQMYVDPGEKLGMSTKEVIYDFINARIVSFDLDELTHDASDVSLMTMQFDYDWMEIVDAGSLQTMDGPKYNIAVPGIGGAPVDMSTYGKNFGNSSGAGGAFANIINNQLGRAVGSVTSEAINRGVSAIAGKGQFATALGSSASSVLNGLVGAATRSLASGIGTVNQATAVDGTGVNKIVRPSATSTNVIDTAEGGPSAIVSQIPPAQG